MSLTVSNTNSGSNFEPIPAGNYVARCTSMVHIGTILESFEGSEKELNKIRITFELPTELKEFKQGEGEKPYLVSKDFTLSLNEKATLRKYLESWRGKAFTEEEAKGFDLEKLLGVPATVNIIHKTSKGGKNYAEIASITPMMKGLTCPPQFNPTFVFSHENFDQEKFDMLPEWLRKKIKTSKEYIAMESHFMSKDVEKKLVENADDDLPF